jgi:hypothetical protein
MQTVPKQLCQDLLLAKINEDAAKDRRIAIEQEIIALTGLPDEGTLSVDAEGHKIKIEQKIDRKLDEKAWALIADKIPEAVRPVSIVETLKLDVKGVKWLRDNEPGFYKLLCGAMTEKPAKPSVKVEAVAS